MRYDVFAKELGGALLDNVALPVAAEPSEYLQGETGRLPFFGDDPISVVHARS